MDRKKDMMFGKPDKKIGTKKLRINYQKVII